ncbi:MAG: hypothetical protein ACKN96_04525 [Actinomycetota bacterium]
MGQINVTGIEFALSDGRVLLSDVSFRVGEGRFTPKWVEDVLEKRERVSESLVFPARGLTLVGVEYPADNELEARAMITIARRDEY